jgi:predicted N-acetyltransferase YhbS
VIRSERPGDELAIAALIDRAFAQAAHSDGGEAAIVDKLRRAGALTLSLVFAQGGGLMGHVAFSAVAISGQTDGWFGLGPVAVEPVRQRQGVGTALIQAGLAELRIARASGCVVLGDPAYYGRFGFRIDPRLCFPSAPAEFFQTLAFGSDVPPGEVAYHPAFR